MTKAFLGVGLLGSNWVRGMLKRGDRVNVWNRTFSRTAPLAEAGAKAFENVSDAVKGVQFVHICVSDDNAVNAILAQAEPGFDKNTIIIDHTTTSTKGAKYRTEYWKSKGVTYIHVPVFMGPSDALNSTGTMLISGDKDVISLIEPEVQKMTGRIINYGDAPDTAAKYKLLGNHTFLVLSAGIADAFTLGKSMGISADDASEFIEKMTRAPMSARIARLRSAQYDEPTWELLMARKDARLMQDEAEREGNSLMIIPALGSAMEKYIADGEGHKDWTIFSKEAVS